MSGNGWVMPPVKKPRPSPTNRTSAMLSPPLTTRLPIPSAVSPVQTLNEQVAIRCQIAHSWGRRVDWPSAPPAPGVAREPDYSDLSFLLYRLAERPVRFPSD